MHAGCRFICGKQVDNFPLAGVIMAAMCHKYTV